MKKRLRTAGLDKPYIRKDNFVRLLQIATKEVEFGFNNILYCQLDGIALESSLGPTSANISMGYLEYKVLLDFEWKVNYFRYVDDCFIITKSENIILTLFDKFNNVNKATSFTKETETNNHLQFIDVLIKRRGDKFLTTVYQKPTFTGQYLNFRSYCSKRRKRELMKTLFHRAHKICFPELFSEEIIVIKYILQKNDYPCTLVDKIPTL